MRTFRSRLILIAITFALIIGAAQWIKWQNFGYNGLDLAIYSQTSWSLAHGHGFANSIHDPTYRADHLELILVPLAAVYRLFPNPLTLLWIQTIAIAVSGLLIGLLARSFLSPKFSLLAAGLFLAHPLIYNAAMYEFHGLTMALPMIVGAIIAFEKRRWGLWATLVCLTILFREDLPLLALGWAVLAAFRRIPWRWWTGVAVISVAWFFIAQQLIASVNPSGGYKYLAFVSWLGSSPQEILTFPFLHPIIFFSHLISANNWAVALGFLVGFGFLPLLRPGKLIPLCFIFAQELVLGGSATSVLHLHYVIPYLPFLAWATLDTIKAVKEKIVFARLDHGLALALVTILAIVGPIYLQLIYGWAELPWRSHQYADQTSARILHQAIAQITPTDSVLTTFRLLPVLANRSQVYSLNYVYLGRRQYSEVRYTVPGPITAAVIDWSQVYDYQFLYRDTFFENQTGEQRISALLQKNNLSPVWQKGSVVVYRQGSPVVDAYTRSAPRTSSDVSGIILVDSQVQLVNQQAQVQLRWQNSFTPGTPVSIQFSWINSIGKKKFTTRLLGEGWQPATTWSTDRDWISNYTIDLGADKPTAISVEWLQLTGHYRLDRLRTFRPVIDRAELLGSTSLAVES